MPDRAARDGNSCRGRTRLRARCRVVPGVYTPAVPQRFSRRQRKSKSTAATSHPKTIPKLIPLLPHTVLQTPLEQHGISPATGFFRDNTCCGGGFRFSLASREALRHGRRIKPEPPFLCRSFDPPTSKPVSPNVPFRSSGFIARALAIIRFQRR
jgi:hypothetical protein